MSKIKNNTVLFCVAINELKLDLTAPLSQIARNIAQVGIETEHTIMVILAVIHFRLRSDKEKFRFIKI